MSAKRGVDFLKALVEYSISCGGHDVVTKAIRITGGGDGRCIGEFTIAKEHTNCYGTLHGGCAATMIDNITTCALASAHSHPGLTVDLYINYLKSAKQGEEIIFDANVLKFGRKLAFVECVFKSKSNGNIIVKGGQTKYIDFGEWNIPNKKNQ